MGVPTKDAKILWARAAGRCSMSDCRAKVIEDGTGSPSGKDVLIGQTCHIVSRKPKGPRGDSVLPADDRDRYPNLIVLCCIHHTLIDRDPESWPIELLHQIKADHELWVEENLNLTQQSKSNKAYSHLVDLATDKLFLSAWDDISDHAVAGMLSDHFVQGGNEFTAAVFRFVWPDEKPELEAAIQNLAKRVGDFLRHFTSRAEYRPDNNSWREDKTWKRTLWSPDQYDYHVNAAKAWQQQSFDHLCNVVVALNEFAQAVRTHLVSDYFITQGKFTVFDSMGLTNDLETVHYLPSEYTVVAAS